MMSEMIRACRPLALVALALAGPVHADPAAPLRAALAAVPQLPGSTDAPGFADLDVAADVLAHRDLTGIAPFFTGPLGPLSLATPLGQGPLPTVNSERAWPQLVGFAPDDIRTVVNYGTPPDAALRLTLTPGVMPRVETALAASGYERLETGQGPLLRRGGEDYAISLLDRDPEDPFGGMLGQASRVLVQGDMLTRSAGMPVLEAGMTGPFWGERADLAALLDMLSDLPPGTGVMRAQLLTDQLLFARRGFPPTGEDTVQPPGIPPWHMGMLVELVEGKHRDAAALMAFVYATRDLAEAALRGIEAGWTTPGPARHGSPAERIGPATLRVEGEGPFVAVLHVAGDWTTTGILRNEPFARLHRGYLEGDLPLFAAAPP